MAWRALRQNQEQHLNYLGIDSDMGAMHEQLHMLGSYSSEGDAEDSWDARQYK